MPDNILTYARHLSDACNVSFAVIDYSTRGFHRDAPCAYCANVCKVCDFRNTHLYGCFEAERWNGLYIYYCPMNLGFVATVTEAEGRAEHGLITGPFAIGNLQELKEDMPDDLLHNLQEKTPEGVTALARLQWALCRFLSGKDVTDAGERSAAQSKLHNTMYEVMPDISRLQYPLKLEKRLQRMILKGDRAGASELINMLLGAVYLQVGGDIGALKTQAKELVVLFSRAAIDSGVDAAQIFGETRSTFGVIDSLSSIEELSLFLTSMFYRFVGYAFDFKTVRHADLTRKVAAYVNEHYGERITLDELSAHVYLSRNYLSHMLNEAFGMSFKDFVNGVRVEKSKKLLADPTLALSDMATMTGFADQSHFTKVFSRFTGMTPGAYRKQQSANA